MYAGAEGLKAPDVRRASRRDRREESLLRGLELPAREGVLLFLDRRTKKAVKRSFLWETVF